MKVILKVKSILHINICYTCLWLDLFFYLLWQPTIITWRNVWHEKCLKLIPKVFLHHSSTVFAYHVLHLKEKNWIVKFYKRLPACKKSPEVVLKWLCHLPKWYPLSFPKRTLKHYFQFLSSTLHSTFSNSGIICITLEARS